MRKKGRKKRSKNILIRVNKEEKALSEKLSREDGKNTSEFFRSLLKEKEDKKHLQDTIDKLVGNIDRLITNQEKFMKMFEEILDKNNVKIKKR